MDNVTPLHRGIRPPKDYPDPLDRVVADRPDGSFETLRDRLNGPPRHIVIDDRHERRIDYAYIVAGALCAVAGLGLAWIGGVL